MHCQSRKDPDAELLFHVRAHFAADVVGCAEGKHILRADASVEREARAEGQLSPGDDLLVCQRGPPGRPGAPCADEEAAAQPTRRAG